MIKEVSVIENKMALIRMNEFWCLINLVIGYKEVTDPSAFVCELDCWAAFADSDVTAKADRVSVVRTSNLAVFFII